MNNEETRLPEEYINIIKTIPCRVKKIFIVDDSYFAIDFFSHIIKLISPDIDVISARTTAETKEMFKNNMHDIDIVLMDYRLEDAASGVSLTIGMIAAKPDVIVLANSSLNDFNEMLISAGAVGNIHKKIQNFFKWYIEYYGAKI